MAYQDPPDTDDIPRDPDTFRKELFAHMRHTGRMTENIFWVVLIASIFVCGGFGLILYRLGY